MLTSDQKKRQNEFREFADQRVAPLARTLDRDDPLPHEAVEALSGAGYLGAAIPVDRGGLGFDMVTVGLLSYEVSRVSISVSSLLTVHAMAAHALMRFGSDDLVADVVPKMAAGTCLGAFALSEPGAGSNASAVETRAAATGVGFRIEGTKRWITGGMVADQLLVAAVTEDGPTMFLVAATAGGVTRSPIADMLGQRGTGLAEIRFAGTLVSDNERIGPKGGGIRFVALSALDLGRYLVAWSSAGLAQACLDASLTYSSTRETFGKPIREHQLIRRKLSNMMTDVSASKLMCLHAGLLKDSGDPDTIANSTMAKYFASRVATRSASDALQIHGANGCTPDHEVSRLFRDAQILEIIEGSTEIQQTVIPSMAPIAAF